jgi:hypothetical protein
VEGPPVPTKDKFTLPSSIHIVYLISAKQWVIGKKEII